MANYMTEFSPDNDSHVYQVKDIEATPISLLEDTVGWTGKNLLNLDDTNFRSKYANATYTRTSTGIEVKNTNAGTYQFVSFWLKNLPKNKNMKFSANVTITSGTAFVLISDRQSTPVTVYEKSISSSGSVEFTFNTSNYDLLAINFYCTRDASVSGDIIYDVPMIRDATITDSTYEPYHKSVEAEIEQVYADNGVLGAKNLLRYPYDGTVVGSSIFTVNNDGSVKIDAGTHTTRSYIFLEHQNNKFSPQYGNYIITADGIVSGVSVKVEAYNGSTRVKQLCNINDISKSGTIINFDYNGYDRLAIYIDVASNTVLSSDTIIYPMLRLASDPDDTYVPYAMTNRELTDAVTSKTATATKNGITYLAELQGKLVTITTVDGSLTEAIAGYTEMVKLSDFDIFTDSDVFDSAYFCLATDSVTIKARIYTSTNDARLMNNNGIAANSYIRFTLVGFIK